MEIVQEEDAEDARRVTASYCCAQFHFARCIVPRPKMGALASEAPRPKMGALASEAPRPKMAAGGGDFAGGGATGGGGICQ